MRAHNTQMARSAKENKITLELRWKKFYLNLFICCTNLSMLQSPCNSVRSSLVSFEAQSDPVWSKLQQQVRRPPTHLRQLLHPSWMMDGLLAAGLILQRRYRTRLTKGSYTLSLQKNAHMLNLSMGYLCMLTFLFAFQLLDCYRVAISRSIRTDLQ